MNTMRHNRADLKEESLRTEEMLHGARFLLEAMLRSIPDVIYWLDADGRILFISDAIRRYGYAPEELIGVDIMTLIHPGDREKAAYRVNERRTRGRSTRALEVRLLTKEDTSVPFEILSADDAIHPTFLVSAEGVYTSDRPRAQTFWVTQGVARDITERKKTEEGVRDMDRARVLSETAGGIAHEINQPLTVMFGILEMRLMEVQHDESLRKELEVLIQQAERISEIVSKMQNTRRYATKPYIEGKSIVDFDVVSRGRG